MSWPQPLPILEKVSGIARELDGPLDVPRIMSLMPSNTDAVTVYRTLNTFIGKKLIHRFRGEPS